MVKKSSRIKYEYAGEKLNVKEIYSRNKKRRGRSKYLISFRVFLHFICLKMVVTICGFLFRWYSSGAEYMVILLVFVIIYVSVWGISWWLSKRDEVIINIALRKNRDAE